MLSYGLQLIIGNILQKKKQTNHLSIISATTFVWLEPVKRSFSFQRNNFNSQTKVQPGSYPAWWKLPRRVWAGCGFALPKRPYTTAAVTLMTTFGPCCLSCSCTFSLGWNSAPDFCFLLHNVMYKNNLVPHLILFLVPCNLSNTMIYVENILWCLVDSIFGLKSTAEQCNELF